MPIHGLSDERRLPRAGKIHLGIKKQSKKSNNLYPDATDYFVVKADESTPETSAAAFAKVYGQAPKRLKIILPLNNPDAVFPHWYKQYSAHGLICRGDGKTANRWIAKPDKTMEKKEVSCVDDPTTCPYVKLNAEGKLDCGPVANLQFLLPEVPIMGVWQIDTSSRNGIIEINSTMEMLQFETERITGRKIISGIPMYLSLTPRKANPDGRQKTIFILHLDYQEGVNEIKAMLQKNQLPSRPVEVPVQPIDEDEIPADLRPQITHSGPHQAPAPIAPAAKPDPLEPPEDAGIPDPIEQAVLREYFRLGIPEGKQAAFRRSYADPAKLLSVLQNTKITKERLAQLRAMGKEVNDNGYEIDERPVEN